MGSYPIHVRSRFWPKGTLNWATLIVTLILMPTIYIYEMFVVYPVAWGDLPFFSDIVPIGGILVFVNIVSNYVGLVVISTEVPHGVISAKRPSPKWHYCDVCVGFVPPRSWHCKNCNVCILKRDHHCLFGSCCIGHYNSRFFLMFLSYLFIGSFYSVISDIQFLSTTVDLSFPKIILKIGFPAFAYLCGVETLTNEFYILLSIINGLTLTFVCIMLRFHARIALDGQVSWEVTQNIDKYNLGLIENIKIIMGNRWYIAWAFPLIPSPLPRNGIDWNTTSEWKHD